MDNIDKLLAKLRGEAASNFSFDPNMMNFDPNQGFNADDMTPREQQEQQLMERLKNIPLNQQAQFNLTIARTSNNLDVNLPYALFGYQFYPSQYTGIITPPTGLTYSVSQPNISTVRFAWTNGILTDNIDITCKELYYPSMLIASAFDRMIISKMRYKISDKTKTDQYDLGFETINKLLFGSGSFNELTPSTYFDPNQQQEGVVDVDVFQRTSKNSVFKHSALYIAGNTSFKTNLTFFVPMAKMFTAAGLG